MAPLSPPPRSVTALNTESRFYMFGSEFWKTDGNMDYRKELNKIKEGFCHAPKLKCCKISIIRSNLTPVDILTTIANKGVSLQNGQRGKTYKFPTHIQKNLDQ